MEVEQVRIVYLDVFIDVLSSFFDHTEISQPLERWLAIEDFHKVIDWKRVQVTKMSHTNLCSEMKSLFTLSNRYLSLTQKSGTWYGRLVKRGLLFLEFLGATYVHPTVVAKLVSVLIKERSEEMIDSITFVINASLYLLRFWLSWKVFLLLYPDGREFLKKVLKDPLQLITVVISLLALGIPSDYLASYLVTVIDYLGISDFATKIWPTINLPEVIAGLTNSTLEDITRSLNLEQLGITPSYREQISQQYSKYTARGYLQAALKKLDDQLKKLSQPTSTLLCLF
jgi:hypothetical protein